MSWAFPVYDTRIRMHKHNATCTAYPSANGKMSKFGVQIDNNVA